MNLAVSNRDENCFISAPDEVPGTGPHALIQLRYEMAERSGSKLLILVPMVSRRRLERQQQQRAFAPSSNQETIRF